jgi:hypothetical protein
VLDLLEWIGRESRPYSEVIEVWRTSCPKLPVWEEANARGSSSVAIASVPRLVYRCRQRV